MKQILIVDDSGMARRTMRQILQEAGYTVEEAKDGHEAIEKYYLRRPDLVLLDMVMEGLNGMEVLLKLKEIDPRADVIIASADIQKASEAEARAAGAIGYVTKPYDRDRVLDTVSKVLAGGVA